MAQTKDYAAHRHHLGKTMYCAVVYWDDLGEWDGNKAPAWVEALDGHRFFPNLGLAKRWVTDRLTKASQQEWPDHGGFVAARIDRGRWESDSFHDDGYGTVHDAEFIEDDDFYWTAVVYEQGGKVMVDASDEIASR